MSTTQACLGCNGAADAHDRRLLAGPTSREVLGAWKEIIAAKVRADKSLDTAAALVEACASSGDRLQLLMTLT